MNGSYDPYPDFSPLYEPTSFSWWLFSFFCFNFLIGRAWRALGEYREPENSAFDNGFKLG
jgi:hypothetical protein